MAQQSDIRVVVIGAGMAGILAGIKLQEMGIDNVTIYEKADRIGGTWRENTYPGLTCDTPSHHYTYKFERNPDWSRFLPPGEEIQAYFEKVTAKYGIEKLIRFNQEASSAEFVDGRWQLAFKSGLTDSADVIITATGVLHHPSYPDIPGMDSFKGALFHSARWDHSGDLDGKRIGVIGNGSTGVQIISALAGRMAKLTHFQRTALWILPVDNAPYSDEQRASFQDPEVLAEAMNFAEYNQNVDAYTQAIINIDSDEYRFWADA